VAIGEERELRDRFAGLGGRDDGDWNDVRRRARQRSRRVAVLVATVAVALVATGFGLGGQALGLFDNSGTPVPLEKLSERDRQTAVFSLCQHITLVSRPGREPVERCLDGEPKVTEIANDGKTFYWKLSYPNGVTCLASGPVEGFRDPNRGPTHIGMMGCNVGAPTERVVPTPKRPITTNLAFTMDPGDGLARITNASGLVGSGITNVGLVALHGSVLKTTVKGKTYDFGRPIPTRDWVAITAYDESGKEVHRERISVAHRPSGPPLENLKQPAPSPLPPLPAGRPIQHGETPVATIDVYRSSSVAVHFSSMKSDIYRTLERTGGATLACGDVAFGAGRWLVVAGGNSTQPLRQDVRTDLSTRYGGFPSTPYDYCELQGRYGRYWNDEEGTHELVEVPFTAVGRRFLDERATARDLGYFVRTRKMWQIRKAVHRGENAPSAAEIARRFGPRVVPLADRAGEAPTTKIGVWTDGKVIVASELAPNGRRLFVTVGGVRIGATNTRQLAFVF